MTSMRPEEFFPTASLMSPLGIIPPPANVLPCTLLGSTGHIEQMKSFADFVPSYPSPGQRPRSLYYNLEF